METKIQNRLAELREATREAEIRLIVLRSLVAEWEAMLQPTPIYSGDPLVEES